jgi:nucleoside-diphosphate-sugar epimerase
MGREWHFVKRALDHRPHVILTSSGAGRFHTTASENIGELVRLLAAQPARSDAYNCGDPDAPSVLEIARATAAAAGHSFDEVLSCPSRASAGSSVRRRGRRRSRSSSTWPRPKQSSAIDRL